jgi:hypothetical protein
MPSNTAARIGPIDGIWQSRFQAGCSIKGEVKKKHTSFGWNFSCFAAPLIERDLF